MRSWVVVAVVAACGGDKRDEPAPAPAPAPAATPQLELVRCIGAPPPPAGDPAGMIAPAAAPAARNATVMGQTSVQGDLDKAVIRRYVRRDLDKITACYEKQLLATPALQGKVEAHFFIDASGKVTSSKAEGLDPKVAACVAMVIAQIEFPKPRGGGGVQVNYPFSFRVAGSDPPATPAAPPPPPVHHAAPPGNRLGTPLAAWTPYAFAAPELDDAAIGAAATAAASAAQSKLAELDACFGAAHGSLRAMLAFDITGAATGVRAGGLANAAVERCVAGVLRSLQIARPRAPVELACDFRRGADAPWRVTPDAGYFAIAVHATGVAAPASPAPADGVALVAVDPDATKRAIGDAIAIANPAAATIVAVQGTFVAEVGRYGDVQGELVDLTVIDGKVVPTMLVTPPPGEPLAQADHVLAAARARCKDATCAAMFPLDELPSPQDLMTIALAARRAGFERVGLHDHASYGFASP